MSEIQRLQQIDLTIIDQILQIIERHSLKYYMLGGTLLGAIRHKGFIPWDDDIDIGLPRPDYERFLVYAQNELTEPFLLHTAFTEGMKYGYYYARVERSDIKLKRVGSYQKIEINAFVDVFPLDGVPSSLSERELWLKRCNFYKHLFVDSQFYYYALSSEQKGKQPFYKSFVRNIALKLRLDRLISTRWAWKQLHKSLTKYDYDCCDTLINFCGYWGVKEMFPKEVYGEGRLYQFEDHYLMGPNDYDFVLTQMYGDYMTPPEEANRDHHYLEIVE